MKPRAYETNRLKLVLHFSLRALAKFGVIKSEKLHNSHESDISRMHRDAPTWAIVMSLACGTDVITHVKFYRFRDLGVLSPLNRLACRSYNSVNTAVLCCDDKTGCFLYTVTVFAFLYDGSGFLCHYCCISCTCMSCNLHSVVYFTTNHPAYSVNFKLSCNVSSVNCIGTYNTVLKLLLNGLNALRCMHDVLCSVMLV